MGNYNHTTKWQCAMADSDYIKLLADEDSMPSYGALINFKTGNNHGAVCLSPEDTIAFACHLLTTYIEAVDPEVIMAFAQTLVDDAYVDNSGVELTLSRGTEPVEGEKAPEPERKYTNLSPQARLIYQHMKNAGSISARDAFSDHGITSAVLSRRITDIVREGFAVTRERRTHPISGRLYTRYSLA